MSFSKWVEEKKKKEQEQTSATQQSSYTSFSEWLKNKEADKVNQEYINSFITDANSFLSSAEKEYGELTWGSASDAFSSRLATSTQLKRRASAIGTWLERNKNNINEEAYKSLYDAVKSFESGSTSIADSFREKRDFYSQFSTEDAYNAWNAWHEKTKHQENERKAVLSAYDFDKYFTQGNEYGEEQSIWDKLTGKTYNSVANMRNDPNALKAFEDSANDANGASWGTSERILTNQIEYKAAKYMTDDEFKVYNYYFAKDVENGTNTAKKFLESIEESLNIRAANEKFADLEGNTFSEILFGIEAGLDQFESGIINLFDFKSDSIIASPTQMTSGMVREDLSDEGFKLPDWMGGASFGQLAYDMTTTSANMLPSILTSAAANVVAPGSGAIIGATLLGASASGNAYAEMLNLGYDKGQARAYSLLVGASEAGLQYALGGISKLGGKVTGNAISKFVSKFDNAIARTAIKLGGGMMSEGLEEAIQSVIEPVFKRIVTGDEFEGIAWDEVIYSGLMGAMSAGLLEGPSTIAGEVKTYTKGKALQGKGTESIDRLVSLGQTFSADTVAYKLAGKVNEKTGAYTIGRLLNEVGASLSEQNKADISKALVEKGMTEKDANTISKWLGKAVDGGYFSKRQIAALESNEVISSIFQDVIINQNSAVNQRIQGYNESLHTLAEEMSRGKAVAEPTEAQQTPSDPTAMLSDEEIIRRIAEASGVDASVVAENFSRQAKATPVTENTPTKEIATEGKFEASEDGKTTYNGNEVKIARIAPSENGEVMVQLDNGEVVNARDVEFSSHEEALIYEATADMDIDTANDFVQGFISMKNAPLTTPQTALNYKVGFNEAATYGELGIPYEALARDGKYANSLVGSQAQIAYNRGRINGVNKAATTKKDAPGKAVSTQKKSPRKYKGETHVSEIKKSRVYKEMSDTQKAGIDGMTAMYKALGIDVYFFESPTDAKGKRLGKNGYFNPEDNSVHIDLYAGLDGRGTILFTSGHELTHYIRVNLPSKFKAFADLLFEKYEANGTSVASLIAQKRESLVRLGRLNGLTPEQALDLAYEETVADACEAMLADGKAFAELSEKVKAKDKGLWNAIKKFFTDLVAKIKGEYENLSPDSVAGSKLAKMLDTAEELRSMWVDMLVEASEQSQYTTDNIRGNADGAVVQSEVTEALAEGVAENGVLESTRTEYEALPKQVMSLSTGVGSILYSIEGLDPLKVKGLTDRGINGYTGRAVREFAMKNSGFAKKQIAEVNKFMDAMADFMKEAGVTYRFIGLQDVENATLHYTYNSDGSIKSVVLSAMVKNGDYPVNFDLSSICKKRVAMSALIDKLAKRGSIDNGTVKLTPSNIFKINTALKDAGYETACLGCFVESKRYNSLEWAKKFCDKWNAAVKKVNPNATYFGYGNATFNEESFTVEQAIKIDAAANKYIKATKTERLANALAKYKAKEQAGEPLVAGKVMKVDGEELNTFSKAARDRLMKSDTISDELKTKYLTCDVSTLNMADVEFLLENGILPGANLSNKQAVTEMVKSGEAYQHLLRPSDLLTDRGISKLEALPNFHGVLYGHYGSGTPKLMQSYTPYNSEIALLPAQKNSDQTLAEYLYTIAGVRMQSFSDFQIQNIYDYLQMVADLAARKIPAHAYTKEISFAKLLGMTGIKVNLSVMFDIDPMVDKAHAGLTKLNPLVHKGEYAKVILEDAQGKWVYNIGDYQTQRMFEEAYPDEAKRFLQSIGFADAVKLQSSNGYSANCGIIGVGYSDLGIFAMLDDNRIRYIIPYHASSLPADIKVATHIDLGTDYTPYQNNMKIVGIEDRNGNKVNWSIKEAYKRLGSGQAVINELNNKIRNEGWVVTTKKAQNGHGTYGLYENLQETNDPRQTASNFMDWCIGNNTLPLFYQFASHNNYYKMLYDFNVYDCVTEEYAPQQAVTNTYPTMVDGEVKAGTVTDGGFNVEYLQGTIDKQMAFMNQYGENLDSDLEKLADNMENGNYSLRDKAISNGKVLNSDLGLSQYEGKLFSYREIQPITESEIKDLAKHFGTTGNFRVAGYLLTDGKLLDFSGKHWGDTTSRTRQVDHRDVQEVIGNRDSMNGTNAMIDMIGSGNIRLMPEDGGINLAVYPNEKQRKVLSLYINYMLATEGQVIIDYDAVGGDTVYSREYGKTATSRQILADIRNYFNGARQSDLMRFHTMDSDRDPDSVSNRSLLANALESVAQNDIERTKLNEYKSKIALIEAEQAKLAEVKKQANDIRFTKGRTADETKKMKDLEFEANQIANRINTYDRQLLNLESTKALKGVLDREKKMAYKKAEQKGREALARQREKDAETQRELLTRYQESRAKGVEGRKKTEMRHKIKTITSELDTLLRRPTSKKHIKEELRAEVADALLAINMDTVGADERVAHYNEMIARAKDPDIIAELTKTRDRIQLQGDNLKEKLATLHNAYEKIKASDDIELSMSYQEVIQNSIKNVTDKVGNTSIRNMSLEQLEMVYDLFSMIRKTIRNANKAFNEQKGQTIMQMAEAVNDQVRTVGGQPYKRNVLSAWFQREGWHLLKPYVAFRTIGSVTLTNMYKNLRSGEDTFHNDVAEAIAFIEEQYKKHGYKSWDMKKTKTFTAKSGKTFDLTLEQMMTLYAYSKREQAHKHIIEGGIVLENALLVEKNKLGIPIKYEVTTKDAFNLSEETFTEIANYLTAEQKAFVDEMQAYLSDTMGAKGNEVSMELLGVKLFKEKCYLPIKSSQYYMNFKAEEAGEVKLKSPAFSKETVQHANNPIVLHSFTDLWAEHINDMSMYHSFVLALEDFTRVYNYKTRTDAKVETMDTKATIETAYPGATKYISKFLKDLNGGVRGETVGWAEKLTSLAKKGAVLGSASVAVQQPSAVMRAMAMVNPKHFVATTAKSFNLAKHKQDWAELKKYAPIAGIKEMGKFDVGMGKGTVELIKSNETVMGKVDDFLGMAPEFMDEVTWVSIWNAVKRETVHKYKNLRPGSEEFLKVAGERFTDVISLTQVYDSVFSRSDLMRNKALVAKWLTSFMAEPTTTLNMLIDSYVQGKRTGSKKGFIKVASATTGAIVASIVLNSALKSIVMAARDDDEDESYAEKYLEHFFGDLKDNLNPLTLIPVVKDVLSIFDGYDVERMDMSLISDLKKAMDAFNSDNKTAYEKWSGLIGAVSAMFGVPVKNVERDIRAAINTFFGKKESTTKQGLLDAVSEGWTGNSKSNGQQLYEAMMSGDTEQIERVKGRFKDDKAITSAIRSALRENDSRIKEAAEARYNGDIAGYMRIAKEIIAEGHFKQDDIFAAINSEINALKNVEPTTESSASGKEESIYKVDDYYAALAGRDQATAYVVKEDIIKTAIANGKDREDAEESFISFFRSYVGKMYKSGEIGRSTASNMLINHGEYDSDKTYWKLKEWDFKIANGEDAAYSKYTEFYDAVKTGKNLKAVINEYTSHGVETKTLASQITSYYKPIYKEMSNAERANLKGYLLNAYVLLGYNRVEKNKDINKWLED